jgi:hypothetical protein
MEQTAHSQRDSNHILPSAAIKIDSQFSKVIRASTREQEKRLSHGKVPDDQLFDGKHRLYSHRVDQPAARVNPRAAGFVSGLSPDVAPALRRDFALNGIARVRRNPDAAIVAALPSFRKRLIGDVALRQFALLIWADFIRRNLLSPNVAPTLRRNLAFDRFARIRRNPHAAIVAALRSLRRIAIRDRRFGKLIDCLRNPRQSKQRRRINQKTQHTATRASLRAARTLSHIGASHGFLRARGAKFEATRLLPEASEPRPRSAALA